MERPAGSALCVNHRQNVAPLRHKNRERIAQCHLVYQRLAAELLMAAGKITDSAQRQQPNTQFAAAKKGVYEVVSRCCEHR
ncbi:hypothetical protein D3C73_1423200 [compost metagenome]